MVHKSNEKPTDAQMQLVDLLRNAEAAYYAKNIDEAMLHIICFSDLEPLGNELQHIMYALKEVRDFFTSITNSNIDTLKCKN